MLGGDIVVVVVMLVNPEVRDKTTAGRRVTGNGACSEKTKTADVLPTAI